MEIVLASFLSAAVSALAGLLTLRYTQQAEKERQDITERLRLAEQEHEHRARLHADRLAAYRVFGLCVIRLRRAARDATDAHEARTRDYRHGATFATASTTERFERSKEWAAEAGDELSASVRAAEDALAEVQLVASEAVYGEARAFVESVRQWYGFAPGKVDLDTRFAEGQQRFRRAVATELRLDSRLNALGGTPGGA